MFLILRDLRNLSYFNQQNPPANSLLKLKFEELIVNIISNNKYLPLKSYFEEICKTSTPSINAIMADNFTYNLSIPEFARLSARSLSSFKAEFKQLFNSTPRKWLQDKRLEYSKFLIESTDHPLDYIYINSGFQNKSHFTRVFKNKYGFTPGKIKALNDL